MDLQYVSALKHFHPLLLLQPNQGAFDNISLNLKGELL